MLEDLEVIQKIGPSMMSNLNQPIEKQQDIFGKFLEQQKIDFSLAGEVN